MYRFVENLKSDKAFFCSSGSDALRLLLESMGIGQGDQVLVQSYTCPAVPSSVVKVGATPVYVDIDAYTFSMDPDRIGTQVTKKTRAMIIQHTFGIPAEMEPILTVARKYGLRLIEDACHAMGSRYRGQEVGEFGDAAIYSFGWHKPIVLGAGGAAVVNDPDLKQRVEAVYHSCVTPSFGSLVPLHVKYFAYATLLSPRWFWFMHEAYRRLRDFRNGPRKGKIGPLILGYAYQTHGKQQRRPAQNQESASNTEELVRPFGKSSIVHNDSRARTPIQRMAPSQEKRLFGKLDRWDVMVERQKGIVAHYKQNLSRIGYAPTELSDHLEPVYYKYPLWVERKREIYEQAQKERIELSEMFGSPLYPPERKANWQALGYRQGMCPVSERTSDRIIALPVHLRVSDEDIGRIVAFLASYSLQ
jgi:dTDP-4-amino-4,6-dideoxygalactose transaminase